MLKNEMSAVIAAQDLSDMLTAIKSVQSKLPPHVNLPPEVREAMLKINNSNKTFVEDVLKGFDNVKDYMPGYVSKEEMQKDLDLYNVMDQVRMALQDVLSEVEDVMAICGGEAYMMGLAGFHALDTPAKRGMKGAKETRDEWGRKFKRPAKKKDQAPSTPSA